MATCNICYEPVVNDKVHFQCSNCKAVGCGQCLWEACMQNGLFPECFGVKCHRQLTNEELYNLNPDNYKQWLNLIKERIYNRAYLEAKAFEKANIVYENSRLIEIKNSETSTPEEKQQAIETLAANTKRFIELEDVKTVVETNPWIFACPTTGCTNILDSSHSCQTCKKFFCRKCNGELVTGHVCNDDDVKSVDEINRNCKPCPNCHSIIYRSEGCSQMWCTNCKHAFDWISGKILDTTRNFHNPYYVEYMRRTQTVQPTDYDANQCNVLIPLVAVEKRVGSKILNEYYEWVTEINSAQEKIPDKIARLNGARENCIRFLANKREPEFNYMTKYGLFQNYQRLAREYDTEQLNTTIMSLAIGNINSATKENVSDVIKELDMIKEIYNERLAKMDILYIENMTQIE